MKVSDIFENESSKFYTKGNSLVVKELRILFPLLKKFGNPKYKLELNEEEYNKLVKLFNTRTDDKEKANTHVRKLGFMINLYDHNVVYTITDDIINEVFNIAEGVLDIDNLNLSEDCILFENTSHQMDKVEFWYLFRTIETLCVGNQIVAFETGDLTTLIPVDLFSLKQL